MKSYSGKVAFVTGGAGGIGFALAKSLGQRGAKVMLADLDERQLQVAVSRLNTSNIEADFVLCDVSKIEDVQNAANATLDRFGKVHIVVNNAGVSLGGPTGDIAIKDWNWIVGINLMGVVHGVETFTPILTNQGEGGYIINTASMAGHLAMPGGGPYNATKYAVVGYSETIRQELAPHGIGVSVLCPGWVKTSINETSRNRPTEKDGAEQREETEQGKQIAAAIAAGLDPGVVAEWTLAQIAKDRFYIFTHPELQPFVEGRFAEIKADMEASRALSDLALAEATKSGQAPLDVLVIGAGFSGVCAAIQMDLNGITNFEVFDKCEGIGGTWWLNTYPGAACDVPSHFYCYSFEMNPNWSRHFAPQPEIQAYIEHCAEKYGVRDRIHLGHEIVSVVFNDETALWLTTFADGTTKRSRFVINGSGGLHQPKFPDFKGRETYCGTQMHTARWDHSFDPKGKRIAVIGSAASAIQVVPQLAKTAALVTLFQRTPNYIAAREDFTYSDQEKKAFAADPAKMQAIRDETFLDRDTRLYPIVINPTIRSIAADDIKTFMGSKIDAPELSAEMMPNYEVGCKRILISDDFLPALNLNNVAVETHGIEQVTPDGILTKKGQAQDFDAIIYATGFDIEAHVRSMRISGQNGQTLDEIWKDQTDAYKATMVPALPNYFMVTGPNAGVGTTSVVYLIEQTVGWIVDMIKLAGRDKLVGVKPQACSAFSNDIQTQLGKTVWASGCDSWYIASNGRIETLFPGNAQDFADQMASIDEADFTITRLTDRQDVPQPNWSARRENSDDADATSALDPTIKAILSSPDSQNGPKLQDQDPDVARAMFKNMVSKLEGPISIACPVENHHMTLPGRTLDFRLYRPAGAKPNGPALVFFHGGGWVIGDLDTHDNSCRAIANGSGVCIISVDYRRAPEHPFPTPIRDGYDAFEWVAANAKSLNLDPKQIGIGGDSAGGNIAAVVTQLLRDHKGATCAWQVLIYPSTAADHPTQSAQDFASGYGLDKTIQDWFAAHYIPEGADLNDPLISPLKAQSHANLPPAFVATAGFDPLRDAGRDYANALKNAGVPVHYVEFPDLIHGFKSWAGIVPSAGAALKEIAKQVGRLAAQKEYENT